MNSEPEGFFDVSIRTRVVHGPGAVTRTGSIAKSLGASRALIVTDRGIVSAGHVEAAVKPLNDAGIETFVFDEVGENPTTIHVDASVQFARSCQPDLLIGLGGGSCLDTAKGCNFLLAGGGRMQDYWGTGKGRGNFLPMIAIPTTGGTGSEMQSYALISDADSHVKMACGDVRAACRVAILDPALTLTQPAHVTAVTGIDAISHAVETYVCNRRTVFSKMFSREAFRLLARAFPVILKQPDSIPARADMQVGAALAGCAIENSMLGAAHALANPVTARFGTIHGQAVGITLPHVVRYNGKNFDIWYAELLESAGWIRGRDYQGSAAEYLACVIEQWVADSGLQSKLSNVQVEQTMFEAMGREAAAQWTAGFNPRPLEASDAARLYEQAW